MGTVSQADKEGITDKEEREIGKQSSGSFGNTNVGGGSRSRGGRGSGIGGKKLEFGICDPRSEFKVAGIEKDRSDAKEDIEIKVW